MNPDTLTLIQLAAICASAGVKIKAHYTTHALPPHARRYGYLVEGGSQQMHLTFVSAVSDALHLVVAAIQKR